MPKSINQQKRLVVLIVMGAVAILFCMRYGFPDPGKGVISARWVSANLSTGDKVTSGNKSSGVAKTIGKKRPPENDWGRDPFELPRGVKLTASEEGKPVKTIKPLIKKVTAILITDSRKAASINHKVVAVGDLIDGERVLEIRPDRVILEKGGRKRVIWLEKSPIKWTKNERKEHD